MRILAFICVLLFNSCNNNNQNPSSETELISQQKATDFAEDTATTETQENNFTVIAVQKEGGDWGYQIMQNDELFINQPHIPSVSGNKGFSTREKALKTGDYIVTKLNAGIMPPTVTPAELDSLEVLN